MYIVLPDSLGTATTCSCRCFSYVQCRCRLVVGFIMPVEVSTTRNITRHPWLPIMRLVSKAGVGCLETFYEILLCDLLILLILGATARNETWCLKMQVNSRICLIFLLDVQRKFPAVYFDLWMQSVPSNPESYRVNDLLYLNPLFTCFCSIFCELYLRLSSAHMYTDVDFRYSLNCFISQVEKISLEKRAVFAIRFVNRSLDLEGRAQLISKGKL